MRVLLQTAGALRAAVLLVVSVTFAGCAHGVQSITPPARKDVQTAATATQSVRFTANIFEAARHLKLKDADFDKYITAPLSPADRKIAHKLMAFMPPGQRGDFIYVAPGNRLVSNNPALLKFATLSPGPVTTSARASNANTTAVTRPVPSGMSSSRSITSSARHVSDYSSPCSPPNPPSYPKGPYVRMVSKCGFAAGWGFVNVPIGKTSLQAQEAGHLYFEIRGTAGDLVEGGLEYYNDGDIAPYMKSSTQKDYISLHNGAVRYGANQELMIVTGVTDDGVYIYNQVGQLPPNVNPQQTYLTGYQVSLSNAAWTFWVAPSDFRGAGPDPAGNFTPCMGCSVSKVTSLAQNQTDTWVEDGSYFGVDIYSETNEIVWNQVLFGNWSSNCEPGTTLCTLVISPDPPTYFGGPQYYPDQYVSDANLGPTYYGPYESNDGIDTYGDLQSVTRQPLTAFTEPLPPPTTYGTCDDVRAWLANNAYQGTLTAEPMVGTTVVFDSGGQAVYNGSDYPWGTNGGVATYWNSNGTTLTGADIYDTQRDIDHITCQ